MPKFGRYRLHSRRLRQGVGGHDGCLVMKFGMVLSKEKVSFLAVQWSRYGYMYSSATLTGARSGTEGILELLQSRNLTIATEQTSTFING